MRNHCLALILSVFLLASATSVLACPNCSRAVSDNDKDKASSLGAGYSYSIYFMMGVPYLILGTVSYAGYRSFSRAMAKHEVEYYEKNGLAKPD